MGVTGKSGNEPEPNPHFFNTSSRQTIHITMPWFFAVLIEKYESELNFLDLLVIEIASVST